MSKTRVNHKLILSEEMQDGHEPKQANNVKTSSSNHRLQKKSIIKKRQHEQDSEVEEQKHKRPRKKIKQENRAYTPKTRNTSSSGDVLAMRCDNRKIVENEGKQELIRTSFMIDTSLIHTTIPFSPRKLNAQMNIPSSNTTFRPIMSIEAYNAFGSPEKINVISPEKNTHYSLTRDGKIGPVSLFSNRNLMFSSDRTPVTKLEASHEFYESQQYKKIKKYFHDTKEQEVLVNTTLLRAKKSERRKNDFRRVKDQNPIMNGSANEYANAAGLSIEGVKWEWLHLIAHEIAGAEAQCMDNLVGGTFHANTNMIFVERELAFLTKRYPQGFTLKVDATLIEKTDDNQNRKEYLQLGTQLEYTIVTDDFTIPFKFNPQTLIQPHIDYRDYVRTLFRSILNHIQESDKSVEKEKAQTNYISHYFTK